MIIKKHNFLESLFFPLKKYLSRYVGLSLIVFLFATLCISGCGTLKALFEQNLYNYSQDQGVTANDPRVIDGDLNTVGKSVFIAEFERPAHMFKIDNPKEPLANNYVSYARHLAPPSETLINLPERKSINKIIIHSMNLVDFVVQTRGDFDQWNTVYEHRAETLKKNKNNLRKKNTMYSIKGGGGNQRIVVANENFPVFTDGIRIYVYRTTDDATQRRKNTEPGYRGFRWRFDGRGGKILTRRVNDYIVSPALIREVEVYGLVAGQR